MIVENIGGAGGMNGAQRVAILVVGLIVGGVGLFAGLGVGAMKVAEADQW